MINKPEIQQEELLLRFSCINEDIRFIKDHQWKVVYYTLLFYAALVGVFQLDVPLGVFHYWAKLIANLVVFWILLFATYHLRSTSKNLDLYRVGVGDIDDMLNGMTGIRNKLNLLHTNGYISLLQNSKGQSSKNLFLTLMDRDRQSKLYSKLFDWLFIFIVFVSGLATIVIIYFDPYYS